MEMSSQQHSQSLEDDCSLSDFDSAGLSLCNVSEMENFTGNSNLETQTGSVEIVDVANEGVQSAQSAKYVKYAKIFGDYFWLIFIPTEDLGDHFFLILCLLKILATHSS